MALAIRAATQNCVNHVHLVVSEHDSIRSNSKSHARSTRDLRKKNMMKMIVTYVCISMCPRKVYSFNVDYNGATEVSRMDRWAICFQIVS